MTATITDVQKQIQVQVERIALLTVTSPTTAETMALNPFFAKNIPSCEN